MPASDALKFVRILLSSVILVPGFVFACAVVIRQRPTWRAFVACGVFCVISSSLSQYVLGRDSPLTLFCAFLMSFGMAFFGFGQRGWALFFNTLFAFAITFLGDTLSGLALINLFDAALIDEMRYLNTPYCYLLNALSTAGFFLSGALIGVIRYLFFSRTAHVPLRALRLSAMVFAVSILFARTLTRVNAYDNFTRIREVLPDFFIICLFLLIGGSYIVQDIRYVATEERNKSLLHERETQDELLRETRFFRHNIANLLYGLQGTILSRDFAAIEKYYKRMVDTCALINNENVLALRRLPNMPVGTLLLNKIKQANDADVPFYVSVDEHLAWRGLHNEDMCQVIGALLDNALEATRESRAPYMSLEIHNAGDSMEMVVRNTFNEDAPPDFLDVSGVDAPGADAKASGKQGHEGLGLKSVTDIVSRSRRAVFNVYRQGRYVEASLLLG